ncbi:uncharacterized protein LY79DRAFT_342869 [Colletotrichum navitas]|uniref:Uncharacterized protein n=1 Tax=Colletotrichum navitas TaxID=681940 RepID=A0AAD8PSZ1_9PEZI|nr:uncharacterized protein LY79DRAFT_342869 [Colletotrichum navitas]KAK1579463.1 hypothetical protein LY79DRAFT_342869 [Colletotrichum navitas]
MMVGVDEYSFEWPRSPPKEAIHLSSFHRTCQLGTRRQSSSSPWETKVGAKVRTRNSISTAVGISRSSPLAPDRVISWDPFAFPELLQVPSKPLPQPSMTSISAKGLRSSSSLHDLGPMRIKVKTRHVGILNMMTPSLVPGHLHPFRFWKLGRVAPFSPLEAFYGKTRTV